ncbi:ribosome small subunit-dependent GTPase A [Bacteroidota bacterium]
MNFFYRINMQEGLVVKSTGNFYKVKNNENKIFSCKVRGKLKHTGIKSTNPVAVGDIVTFSMNKFDDVGLINEIKERKNYIIRKATNLSKQTHIIAANVDQVLLVISVKNPVCSLMFIDRFLITAEAFDIPAVLIINKVDLIRSEENKMLQEYIDIYKLAGYSHLEVSALTGYNIEKLAEIMRNKTSVITGNSGVGKSSIINRIDPALKLKVKDISDSHQTGKHATTYAEMFPLKFGGYIIDTPGIKSFGLPNFDKNELFHFFPEIFNYSKNCKFYNCTHIHEPDCYVIKMVEEGLIAYSRYRNYVYIFNDEESKYRL